MICMICMIYMICMIIKYLICLTRSNHTGGTRAQAAHARSAVDKHCAGGGQPHWHGDPFGAKNTYGRVLCVFLLLAGNVLFAMVFGVSLSITVV